MIISHFARFKGAPIFVPFSNQNFYHCFGGFDPDLGGLVKGKMQFLLKHWIKIVGKILEKLQRGGGGYVCVREIYVIPPPPGKVISFPPPNLKFQATLWEIPEPGSALGSRSCQCTEMGTYMEEKGTATSHIYQPSQAMSEAGPWGKYPVVPPLRSLSQISHYWAPFLDSQQAG